MSAMLSSLSMLETYDTTHLIAIFLISSACVILYFVIKGVNKEIALLSLPFMIGVFSLPFEIAYQWGLWLFMSGVFFVICVVWSLTKINEKYGFLLLGLFLAATSLAHFSELVFVIGFIVFYYILKLIYTGKIEKTEIKNLMLAFGVFAIISAYYIIIVYFTYLKVNTLVFDNVEVPIFAPTQGVNFSNFGIIQFLLPFAILLGIGAFLYKKDIESLLPNVKILSMPFVFSLFMLIIGFTNYIGFNRAFQTRIAWPIYLSFMMALSVYFVISFFKKWKYSLSVAVSLLLIIVFSSTYIGMIVPGGIMGKGTWDGIVWLGEETPTNSKIMHFYGPTITQNLISISTKRVPYGINTNEYVEALQNGIIKNDYEAQILCLTDMKLPYRKSPLEFGYHTEDADFQDINIASMWDMDYYFIPIVGSQRDEALIMYNRAIGEYLMNQTWIDMAYVNNEIVILKNSEPGRKT
ncbi:MAG: hypothetical protein KAS04_00915 [Candidatus Aenigmarchaeota archaeon]|nr:hypothetical protein [Candidatus Aenigmarchaeota archaeon]